MTVTGQLVISNLNSQDNLTMYYCSVVVDVTGPTNYSDFVITGTATSDNITLVFEGMFFVSTAHLFRGINFVIQLLFVISFQNYPLLWSLLIHLVLL